MSSKTALKYIGLVLLVVAIAVAADQSIAVSQGIIPRGAQTLALGLPAGLDLYGLDNDNALWLKRACDGDFRRMLQVRLFGRDEVLVGIDFRPSDGNLYGLSDAGNIYLIDVTPPGVGNVVLISTTSPRFVGGVQSLADFNPQVDALRVIGTDDSNFALVNSGGNLNLTAVQAAIAYAAGDPAAGANPNLTGGAYTNNFPGAPLTLFYGLDHARDVLITILAGPNGSSATGGGQLTTIGRLVRLDGSVINLTPTADMDIFTDNSGLNTMVGVSGRTLFAVNVGQALPGADLVVRSATIANGGLIDLAVTRTGRRGC